MDKEKHIPKKMKIWTKTAYYICVHMYNKITINIHNTNFATYGDNYMILIMFLLDLQFTYMLVYMFGFGY